MSNFIDDGYTVDGFVSGVPGLTVDLSFRFRPSTAHENQILQGEWEQAGSDGAKLSQATAKFLASHIKSWDGKWPNGQAVPVNADAMNRIRGRLRVILTDVVRGLVVPDDRVAANSEDLSESVGN